MWCIVSKITHNVVGGFDSEDEAFLYAKSNYMPNTYLIRELTEPD